MYELRLQVSKNRIEGGVVRFRDGPLEGVVVRRESTEWCEQRAKLVRADFTQSIGEHWRGRQLEWNRLATPNGH